MDATEVRGSLGAGDGSLPGNFLLRPSLHPSVRPSVRPLNSY